MTAEECIEALKNQKLRQIDDLPNGVGVYALADHLGDIHYIGITAADSFRDRIYGRHVNGSEERSHKLACNYNIGRMWRDRKSAYHVPHDAQIAKDLRREFIRRHCQVACVPLEYTKQELEKLEREILAIAPPDMTSWNATRTRVNPLPEPRDLVDALIDELGLCLDERAALDRQAKLFEKLSNSEVMSAQQSENFVGVNNARQNPQPGTVDDVSESDKTSENVAIAGRPPRGFERIAADGERYVAHAFKDGLYRMADPALGRTKHHRENQLPVTLEEIGGYLSRGYLLRMRGESSKQVNLIAPAEITPVY
ncbi:hypothetical protein [Bradyrhizobium sp. WSM1253]|uniref:hypothetical protein n=1 Tax=Bradyrhizobium sp. WSM1253 TaxID=319003 RepID=UPI00025D1223|nr:hypothetical protein [Bradyrhizobium sp. WSM1253]EIG63593.1 hypothetical protein Bra1253DRAFT_00085 [Bradyrhizobium sp. WSM1253]